MERTPRLRTRIATFFLAILIALPASFAIVPQRAHAQLAVIDPTNLIQNTISALKDVDEYIYRYVLRPLAIAAARAAIQSIIRSTINWANNGFEGSPAYITNMKQHLQGLGDQVANRFLRELGLSGNIDSPFRNLMVDGIRVTYRRSTANNAFFESSRYTLDQFSDDEGAFLRGEFRRGGFGAWMAAWRNTMNNPFGAFNASQNELNLRIRRAGENRILELGWSRGLLSWCAEPNEAATSLDVAEEALNPGTTSLNQPTQGGSPDCNVRTPGSFLHDHIERALGSNIDILVSADDLDELVGALLTGLTNKLLAETGLAGFSEPSSGGGRSPLDEATDPSALYGGSIGSNVNGVVDGQISTLEQFKSEWERIRDAAEDAKESCEERGRSNFDDEIDETLAQAEQMIQKAERAIEKLEAAKEKLATAGGENATEDMRDGFAEYQAVITSRDFPTTQEITFASLNSQDAGDTLYSNMRGIVTGLCLVEL